MKPLIWIIDEEWSDYELESAILKERYPGCVIRRSTYDYMTDLEDFGRRADGILSQIYTTIDGEVIRQLEKCRAIAVYGGGYDRIDIASAKAKGIKVTNVSNYCKEDLADYTLAAIYGFYKKLAPLAVKVKTLPWGAQAIDKPPVRLNRCTLHIIGLGRIGREVARLALNNGLAVTAFDPYVSAEEMANLKVKKVDWGEGLKDADYLSVNCILNSETTNLLTYNDFKIMKPSAYLINTARGPIIKEDDLIRALDEGLLAGAMLDVITVEPPTYREKIFSCAGAAVTPHVSYISLQSFDELKRRAANNLIMGMEGEVSPDLVNP